jgi:hypothetical protein
MHWVTAPIVKFASSKGSNRTEVAGGTLIAPDNAKRYAPYVNAAEAPKP